MRKLLGGSFFVAAAVYIAATKPPDFIMLAAMLSCAVCAALSVTRRYTWAVTGGALLISVSLAMQTYLSYNCSDCLKADALILCGIVYLTLLDGSKLKKLTRALSGGMTVILLLAFILAVPAESTPGRYIIVTSSGSEEILLDTADKPVLLFNPDCSACGEAVTEMIQLDPEGRYWTPVQAGGDAAKGRKYLASKGYRGELFTTDWPGFVPVMVITEGKETRLIRQAEKMAGVLKNLMLPI